MGIEPEAKQKLLKVLGQVMSHQLAQDYFNVPVDPDELQIPEYREVIKHPMDLGTIKSKLVHSKYGSIREVIEDIHLVWANCRAFKKPGSEVYIAAGAVEAVFTRCCKEANLDKWMGKLGWISNKLLGPGTQERSSSKVAGSGSTGVHGRGSDQGQGEAPAPTTRAPPAGAPLRNSHPLARCATILSALGSDPAFDLVNKVFRRAIGAPPSHPTSRTLPPDLNEIRARLAAGASPTAYRNPEEVIQDVEYVLSKCRQYWASQASHPHMANVQRLESKFHAMVTEAGLGSLTAESQKGLPVMSEGPKGQAPGSRMISDMSDRAAPDQLPHGSGSLGRQQREAGPGKRKHDQASTEGEFVVPQRPCAVCARAKKGGCGTPSAHPKCEVNLMKAGRPQGQERAEGARGDGRVPGRPPKNAGAPGLGPKLHPPMPSAGPVAGLQDPKPSMHPGPTSQMAPSLSEMEAQLRSRLAQDVAALNEQHAAEVQRHREKLRSLKQDVQERQGELRAAQEAISQVKVKEEREMREVDKALHAVLEDKSEVERSIRDVHHQLKAYTKDVDKVQPACLIAQEAVRHLEEAKKKLEVVQRNAELDAYVVQVPEDLDLQPVCGQPARLATKERFLDGSIKAKMPSPGFLELGTALLAGRVPLQEREVSS